MSKPINGYGIEEYVDGQSKPSKILPVIFLNEIMVDVAINRFNRKAKNNKSKVLQKKIIFYAK